MFLSFLILAPPLLIKLRRIAPPVLERHCQRTFCALVTGGNLRGYQAAHTGSSSQCLQHEGLKFSFSQFVVSRRKRQRSHAKSSTCTAMFTAVTPKLSMHAVASGGLPPKTKSTHSWLTWAVTQYCWCPWQTEINMSNYTSWITWSMIHVTKMDESSLLVPPVDPIFLWPWLVLLATFGLFRRTLMIQKHLNDKGQTVDQQSKVQAALQCSTSWLRRLDGVFMLLAVAAPAADDGIRNIRNQMGSHLTKKHFMFHHIWLHMFIAVGESTLIIYQLVDGHLRLLYCFTIGNV